MNIETVLELVKARVGISSSIRDSYLKNIIKSVTDELENEKGLSIDLDSPRILMFVVDLSDWRYRNRDSHEGMPRHLQFRLHNLIVSSVSKNDE